MPQRRGRDRGVASREAGAPTRPRRRDGFEGTLCSDRAPECLDAVRAFLDRLSSLMARLRSDGLVEVEEPWVSAGGSTFFDVVVDRLLAGGAADRVLLRSGRYITHDSGENERASPFTGRDSARRFHPAIEAWGAVLSRPEPALRSSNSDVGTSLSSGPADPFLRAPPVRPHERRRRRRGRREAERPARVLPGRSRGTARARRPRGCGV